MSGYTTNEVAELVGLKPTQVRAFVKTGVLNAAAGHIAHHRYRYSFQDIVLLRMAKQLCSASAGPQAITRALRNLKSRLPSGKPLSSVRVLVAGRDVLVQEDNALWHPESGQIQIDFSVSSLTREVAPMVREAARSVHLAPSASADEYYNLGVDLEMVGDDAEAERLYRKAVAQDADHSDAWVNLGRLAYLSGKTDEAIDLFCKALDIDRRHATAWFNLGVAQERAQAPDEAGVSYENAIAADPEFPDAHYNLACLREQAGDKRAALRHLTAYRNLMGR